MKIFTGEVPENKVDIHIWRDYSPDMAYEEGQLSILNQCVEVDFTLLPNWMASKVPEGDVDGETMLHLKDIPEIVSQFIQEQIKEQEGKNDSDNTTTVS